MKFFNFLLKSKTHKSKDFISPDFAISVENVIRFIESLDKNINEDVLFEILCKLCKNDFEAQEIYVFLPIAFVRLCFPKINWLETYNEIDSTKKEIKREFKNTESYQIIFKVSKKHFQTLSQETMIKIAGRSAEFHAMNQLFLDNKNAKLEDIKFTETTVIR
ncbi:hypothetical protein ACEN2I_17035 [Flavobacterium sp. W22_SRS_FK3]|uniref:hypothetical protein n=1 Tax=Flavobacterium sp. W22_SRS_FK3 TaxID=3240275 RepID=UPI003F8FE538